MLPINAAIAPNRSCDRIKVTANTATDLIFNQFKVKIFGIEIALTVKSAISLKIKLYCTHAQNTFGSSQTVDEF